MSEFDMAIIAGIVVAGVLLAVILWARSAGPLREGFQRHWERSGYHLDRVSQALREMRQAAQPFLDESREPYASLTAEVNQHLRDTDQARASLARQRRQLAAQAPAPSRNPILRLGHLLAWGPLLWLRANRRARSLRLEAKALRARPVVAAEKLEAARSMPVEVARRCRALQRTQAEIERMAEELRQAGVHGHELDTAVGETAQLGQELGQVPPSFFHSTDQRILAGATTDDTVLAWERAEQVEAPLRGLLERFRGWQKQLHRVQAALDEMERAIQAATACLGRLPESIEAGGLEGELQVVEGQAKQLQATVSHLEVGDLPAAVESIAEVTALASGLASQATDVELRLVHLTSALPLVEEELEALGATMQQLAGAAEHPVDWGTYGPMYQRLRDVQTAIGPIGTQRTPDQLEAHVRAANRLLAGVRALDREVDKVEAQRRELIPLLQRLQRLDHPGWLLQARDLYERSHEYSPENWSAADDVSRVLEDGDSLRKQQRAAIAANTRGPLPAEQLPQRLEQARPLADGLEAFQRRLARIAAILAAIVELEKVAIQKLESGLQPVDSLAQSLQATGHRFDSNVARQRRQVAELQREGKQLRSALDSRGSGRVEQKAAEVDEWLADGQKVLLALLQALQREIRATLEELASQVKRIQELAPFDLEPAMDDARQLLKRWSSFQTPPAPPGRVRRPDALQILANQATGLLQDRERAHSCLANLESQVTNRVAKPFENWNQARQTGTDRYRALMDLKKRVEADWPPIECQTREVEQLLQAARREENRLQGSGRTVSDVRSALDRVTGYYRELISEAQEEERQTQGDQQKLRDMVSRIEHWQRSLQSYGRSHSRDDYVEDAVDRRLSEIETEVRDLQRRWRGTPPSYREASRELESLWHRSRRDIDTRDGRSVRARDVDGAR